MRRFSKVIIRFPGLILLSLLAILGVCRSARGQWGELPTAIRNAGTYPTWTPVAERLGTTHEPSPPEHGVPTGAGPEAWEEPPFGFSDSSAQGRHIGLGDPLASTSWLNRPYHIGWLWGVLIGDDLVSGRVDQHTNVVGGYRLGWDVDHYWGVEGRFVFSNLDFTDAVDPTVSRTSQNLYWDADFLYYPWGDSRWRPYASVGVGVANFDYVDALNQRIEKSLFEIPFGGGVKYYWKNWMALRFSAMDNLAIGQGPLNTMHNVSFTADVEIHFGGPRTSYFPYSGSIHLF